MLILELKVQIFSLDWMMKKTWAIFPQEALFGFSYIIFYKTLVKSV